MGITFSHSTVYVLDQDSAKAFYTEKLGFEVRSDVAMGPAFEGAGAGIRWLTVGPVGQPEIELILADTAMGHDAETAEQIRALVAKGAIGPGAMVTDDCHKSHRELTERGVVFLSEPAERPYGIEAVFRDDSGNWFSLTERAEFDPQG
ncbi:VOC family protein [Actinokineospora sp.]|uniref:VOC family protein n=1 Tax=Actinokineospora sp. TaxID=1872133 RepID=UPI004038174F